MSAQTHDILVVSNLGDRPEICDALADGGFAEPDWGDGGDDTYALYEELAPSVVVMCAELEAGDARALSAAMRDGASRGIHIVLVGEEDGPIRNALDAADFEVDQFVTRPLAAKALLFCVRKGFDAAATYSPAQEAPAQEAPAQGAPAQEAPAQEAPAQEAPALSSVPASSDDSPYSQGVPAKLSKAIDLAIDDFVADAIGSIGQLMAVAAPMGEQTIRSIDDTAPAPVHELSDSLVDDGWDPPPAPPAREPTLILSDGDAAGVIPHVLPVDITERKEHQSWDAAAVVDVDPLADDEPGLDSALGDIADELSDLQDDINGGSNPSVASTQPGGAFARQLREKMSQMAERLFPDRTADAGRRLVEVGVAHGPMTEIDFSAMSLDSAPPSLAPEPAPYADLASAETFADAEIESGGGEPGGSEPGPTARHRVPRTDTAERGEIDPQDADVASIIARMFTSGFSGRVSFRSPPAEKTVYFDHGRPVFASSNLPHDRMGDLLYREGKITREQNTKSRELLVESGRRMGEILVEKGFIKRRELLPAVRRHIEDVIYSLFALRTGDYVIKPGEFASEERIRLSKHPAAIILEGVRRKYDAAQLELRLGSTSAIVASGDPAQLKSVISVADLSRIERAAIGALDGIKTLQEVSELVGISLLQTYQLAYALVVVGAAEVIRRGDDPDVELDAVRPPTLVGETDLAIDRQRLMAKYALVSESDYFALLGVRRDASSFEIKRAYEAARRDYAQDSFPLEVRGELGTEISEINELLDEAYSVLCDDGLRGSYLAHLCD